MGRSEKSKQQRKEYNKKWSKENRDKRNSTSKKWTASNKEKIRSLNKTRHTTMKELFDSGKLLRATKKKCAICKTIKKSEEFYLSNSNNDGLHGWCKICSDIRTRENARKRLGCSPEEFNNKLKSQNFQCKICGTNNPGKQDFHLDHNHDTKKIRDILCGRCNKVLGMVEENTQILENCKKYLEEHNEN